MAESPPALNLRVLEYNEELTVLYFASEESMSSMTLISMLYVIDSTLSPFVKFFSRPFCHPWRIYYGNCVFFTIGFTK